MVRKPARAGFAMDSLSRTNGVVEVSHFKGIISKDDGIVVCDFDPKNGQLIFKKGNRSLLRDGGVRELLLNRGRRRAFGPLVTQAT